MRTWIIWVPCVGLVMWLGLFAGIASCLGVDIYSQTRTAGVIFEDDFAADTGFTSTANGLFQTGASEKPSKWDGLKANSGGSIEVVAEGVGGSNCVKLNYDTTLQQPVCSLVKHLTGDVNTGYDELYIRYRLRFADTFRAGDGDGDIPYWKFGRLWQNTHPDGSNWTENRVDSKYIMWLFGNSDASVFQTNLATIWGANTGDNLHLSSAGGERFRTRFSTSSGSPSPKNGHLENVGAGAWDLDWTNSPAEPAGRFKTTPQVWHTIEWRFKLATSYTANDGEQQVWFDGVDQGAYSEGLNQGGASGITGPPTARDGSGMNFLVVFDNLEEWNRDWDQAGVDGAIRINDVVVSTDRIGHTYNVGD